ncbi:hypothetical protein [Crateriforma spongiae]|uniref:hypothetical protein n=1 Tax=Crateriforma spongiae TaxID=2724528 RepID=UPI001F21D99F|nr:hypothetical protein [Crateriforma spongiae]
MAFVLANAASAQTPDSTGHPSPVVIDVPMTIDAPVVESADAMSIGEMMRNEQIVNDAIPPTKYESTELPASITKPNGVLTLATDGPAALPALPMRSHGCNPRPFVDCTGPDYCGCHPRTFYGTNPCDDDPILTMSPTVNDSWTSHWYRKALDMVRRKTHIAEAINR